MPRLYKTGTTIVDIAKKLKLSPMTVSRALTGNSEVSDRTRQKVLRTATALGYQPNRWARSLVTRRSAIIGVVIPDIAHSFFAEITCGVEEIVEKSGYDILLCHSRGDAVRERAEVNMLVGSRVDGLIVASVQPERSPEAFASLKDQRIPFVLVDRFFPKGDFTYIRVDDKAAGKLATQCLIDLGHTRIAHIQGSDVSSGSLRRRGYLAALKNAGIPSERDYIVAGNFDLASGREAMRKLLELKPRPSTLR